MKLATTRKLEAVIPTASMADIAFLLIIFFMVTTVHDVDRTTVALPLSQVRVESQKGACYVILEKEGGEVLYKFSDGKQVSRPVGGPGDIYLEASRIAHLNPGREFVIKADAELRYVLVDEILDQLRRAGVQNVLLLTQQKTGA